MIWTAMHMKSTSWERQQNSNRLKRARKYMSERLHREASLCIRCVKGASSFHFHPHGSSFLYALHFPLFSPSPLFASFCSFFFFYYSSWPFWLLHFIFLPSFCLVLQLNRNKTAFIFTFCFAFVLNKVLVLVFNYFK